MTVVSNNQFEMNGVLIGADTPYVIQSVNGIGLPPNRGSSTPRSTWHGSVVGDEWFDEREISISLQIYGDTDAAAMSSLSSLASAWQAVGRSVSLTSLPLTGQLAGWGGVRELHGRPRACEASHDSAYYDFGFIPAALRYVAPDPRWYSTSVQTLTWGPAVVTSGLSFNFAWPLSFGVSTSGQATAINSGTADSWPTWTVAGPVTNPRLTNLATSEYFEVSGVINSGSTLVVDFGARSVQIDSQNYRTWMSSASTWWLLQPGSNTLKYTGTGSGLATTSVSWQSAWWA